MNLHARHCHRQSIETFTTRSIQSSHGRVLASRDVPWRLASHAAQLDSKNALLCQVSHPAATPAPWKLVAEAGWETPHTGYAHPSRHLHRARASKPAHAAGPAGEDSSDHPGQLDRAVQVLLKVALFPVTVFKAIASIIAMTPEDWAKWRQGVGNSIKGVGNNFKQQWQEFREALGYAVKALRGQPLTRRERAHVIRSAADTLKLVPMIVLFILPGGAVITALLLNIFPTMLPSTFDDEAQKAGRIKKQLDSRQETAAAVQEAMAEVAMAQRTNAPNEAQNLSQLLRKVRSGLAVGNTDIINVAPLFSSQLTLDRLDTSQLKAACKFYGLMPWGPEGSLRKRLYNYLQYLEKDDVEIEKEGVERMTEDELRTACLARGLRVEGPAPVLAQQIKDWLELSVKRVLPDSLLLLAPVLTMQSD